MRSVRYKMGGIMKKKKTSIIGIAITIVALIVIVVVSNLGTNELKSVSSVINNIFMPFQNGIILIKSKITGDESQLSDISKLKKDNEELKETNRKLQEKVRELEILKSENNTLKEYVNLKNKYSDYQTIPANVIERSYSNYEKIIIINVRFE